MEFKDLKKSLTEEVKSFYILSCGKDSEDLFLKASALNNIKNKVLTSFIDLNLNVFTNETLNSTALKKCLDTLPFMNDKRLVLIKESEGFKDEKIVDVLLEFSRIENSSTVVVIDACEKSFYEKLFKEEGVTVVNCARLDRNIIETFIIKTCSQKNVVIEKPAIDKLIDFTDGYMNNIEIELNKLINLKLDEKVITSLDVEQNCTKSDEYQIYELTNSLFNKKAERALYIVDDIIKNKKNVGGILTLIYSQIRRLFYAKITKASTQELAKLLDIKEFAVKKLIESCQNVSAKKLKELLILCEETDYNIKSGNLDLISGIYNLVFNVLV